jgi:hypothetical protein
MYGRHLIIRSLPAHGATSYAASWCSLGTSKEVQNVVYRTSRLECGIIAIRLDSELYRNIYATRDRARNLRQFALESQHRAEILLAHAARLCARHRESEAEEAKSPFRSKPRVRHRFHAQHRETVEQLKHSLRVLENIRMTPIDDPELRDVKEDIRKSVRGFYLIMSSGSGSSPLLRAHQSIEGDKICRFRRSAKNASVFMAASFSATAVATN